MSEHGSLAERLAQVLAASPRPRVALDLADELGVPRRAVNQVLYRGLGTVFRKTDSRTPAWSLLDIPTTSPLRRDRLRLPEPPASQSFNLDIHGATWEVEVREIAMSRNDPPTVVERLGPHHRLISVSNTFTKEVAEPREDDHVSSTGMLLAAFALTWEIVRSQQTDPPSTPDWALTLRDLLLQMVAASG